MNDVTTPRRAPAAWIALAVTLALLLGGCTSTSKVRSAVRPSPSATAAITPTTSSPAAPHPVSLEALMRKNIEGRNFRVGRGLARNSAYTRYFITYDSGRLTISGIMNVPRGAGPFPVLILNHGYIDPDVYVNGQGLRREQDYLARRGYVVVHVDYRNHAASDDDPDADLNIRLGYAEDSLNAILALKAAHLPYVDPERVGMLGRSMGGGVTLNAAVVRPGLIDAVVLFAPVSSDAVDNFNRWIRRPDRRALVERIAGAYGTPEANPSFWRGVSAVNFLDRISVPILLHHGTDDESVPIAWTDRTVAALREAGKNVRYYVYEGEHHAFGPQWPISMGRTVSFFDSLLKT